MESKDEESNEESNKKLSLLWSNNFLQVLLLSFSFMFVFTAFQTTGIIEETVLQSIRNESSYCPTTTNASASASVSNLSVQENHCPDHERIYNFTGNGYTSLSILYAVFAFASWLAPSLVAIFHAKWSMVISASIYVIFIASFLFPTTWLLYLLSALLGISAAVLWTAQGHLLSLISNQNTITRDSGIFWAINQCSFFFGNLLVYWQFQGKSTIDEYTRRVIFVPLTIVGIIGVVCFSMLKNIRTGHQEPDSNDGDGTTNGETSNKSTEKLSPETEITKDLRTNFAKALEALVDSLKLFITPNMLLLSLTSIYTGLEFSFLSGVYSTSVGNTKMLGENYKTYVGLVGILLGIGEVVGGSLFGLLGSRTTKKGRTPIVFLGAFVHILCFILIYLNIPNEASLRETSAVSVFPTPSVSIALICAFFQGFGDACFQTQLISTFASVYKESSSQAFAIFKFTQSAASATSFYSSSYIGIVIQVVILVISCLISLITFGIVEWRTYLMEKANQQQKQVNPENNPEVIINNNSSRNKVSNNSPSSSTNNSSNSNNNELMMETTTEINNVNNFNENETHSEKL